MQGANMNYKSRLAAEYLGQDTFWKNDAQKTLTRTIGNYYVKDNAFVWVTSGNLVPTDILELLHAAKQITDDQLTKALEQYDIITTKELAAYRQQMSKRQYSQEDLGEMRAAFGKGTVVVNAITGKRVKL
jgi:hypothetical protein